MERSWCFEGGLQEGL